LHDSTDRTPGYHSRLSIPVSGDSIPPSLKGIILVAVIAGVQYYRSLPASADQVAELAWDGRDFLGRHVSRTRARISVGFVYDGVYYDAREDLQRSFAIAGTNATANRTRSEVILWSDQSLDLNRVDPADPDFIARGWTLSAVHHHDSGILHLGNGSLLNEGSHNLNTIETIAGNGVNFVSGDDGPAVLAGLGSFFDIDTDGEGNVYVAGNFWIRKIDRSGIIRRVVQLRDWWNPRAPRIRSLCVNDDDKIFFTRDSFRINADDLGR